MIKFYKVYDFMQHGTEPQQLNTTRTIVIDNLKICMARTEGCYYAVDNKCPHAGAHLGNGGWCENEQIVCPVHRYKYDLKTGRGLQGDYVKPYPVQMREDGIYIGLEKKWWQF
jgi:3-phenylpropionate/trans-cinnamate dioxygenase ferredoxin subunit